MAPTLFSLIILSSLTVFSQSLPYSEIPASKIECTNFNLVLNQQWTELNSLYKKADEKFESIQLGNSPSLSYKSDTNLVILLHGYLGSPYEMNRLAIQLREKGYSVLNDLIPGYGVSARIANQFDKKYWDQYFHTRYSAAFQCFKNIHLIGFSTGGLIMHKFLASQPKLKATSVHLISPFFSPTLKVLTSLSMMLSPFTPEMPLETIYASSFELKELKIMITHPDYYLRSAPNLNMSEIVKSGQEVIDMKTTEKNSSSVVLYATEKDLVMDFNVTTRIVERDFSNYKLVDYSKTQAPHHLFRPEVSEVALDFEKELLAYF